VKVLVVSAHPSSTSFVGSLREMALNQLQQLGHEVRHHDLYQESFSPVFTPYERLHHVGNIDEKLEHLPELVPYVHNLQWCDALVLVYPTWWGAQPAILKGWIDRVFMNEVAWVLPEGEARIRPLLTNVRRLVVLTTHGSGKFLNSLQGESGKRIALRSIRAMFHSRVRTHWIGIYKLDTSSPALREKKLKRASRHLHRLFD
jgi:NAD(P)H dehydrogenase (quinone)